MALKVTPGNSLRILMGYTDSQLSQIFKNVCLPSLEISGQEDNDITSGICTYSFFVVGL
jgi:hypothetical protein